VDLFKSVTLKDVAAKAGVSYQTVSKVINNKANVSPETEKRIWDAIADLRYTTNYSARSLRRRRSNTIGYTWEPAPPDQSNPILDTFLQSMFRAAEEKDILPALFSLSCSMIKTCSRSIASYMIRAG
jgi:DNA-binding LacI/PurR family transcriptional regulator